MNSKLKELSYDTLYDIKDMLNHQIEKELKAVNLLNFNDRKLSILQNDRKLIGLALAQKNDEAYNLSKTNGY